MNTYDIDIPGACPPPPPFPPGMRRPGPRPGPRPGLSPYVKETTKVSEIKDRFMQTRYKVALTDFDGMPGHDDLTREDRFFQVTAVSYNCENPLEIVHRDFNAYEEALKFFEQTVGRLQALAQLDSRDAQDIRIYADRTGYRRIDPDCCRNCKWAIPADRRNCMFEEWRGRLRGKFFCTNSEMYSEKMADLSPDEGQHDCYHDFARERWSVLDIKPEVDPDGICDGYERRPAKTHPSPPPAPPFEPRPNGPFPCPHGPGPDHGVFPYGPRPPFPC